MKVPTVLLSLVILNLQFAIAFAQTPTLPDETTWNTAHEKPPLTIAETKVLMKRLASFVVENHMKRREDSPQRGMVYEYLDMRRRGEFDQFVQGEALDTMHDGAWLAVAMANAYRATGDPYYKEVLTKWQLPFYLKMLNHSDTLFTIKRNDAREGAMPWNKEHGLQEGEKGFVPYYWDDGGSVSLERRLDKNPLAIRPSVDDFAGKENPRYLLSGYSQGSSNHLAQDLGAMLLTSYLLLSQSSDAADQAVAKEVAEGAQNLHECRQRHHGNIPMCVAPWAVAKQDASLAKAVPSAGDPKLLKPSNHFTQAFLTFKPGQKYSSPGFADNEQYLFYAALGRNAVVEKQSEMPKPLALKLIFDAYTERLFMDRYYDDEPRPPGINRFDLYPLFVIDGKLEHVRSQKKGPFNRPIPLGSRMGPQNMIVCGWALQQLKAHPGLWDEVKPLTIDGKVITEAQVKSELNRELSGGLRTWGAIFDSYGYIPTSLHRGPQWDHFSDSGGYAHLISAASQYLLLMEGKSDWTH
jgi:hypothetical protein